MPERHPHSTARILLADDTDVNIKLLERVFQQAGFAEVDSVTEGAAVLDAFDDFQPDLVLLDLHMPGVDAVDLIKSMRKNAGARPVPILIITGDTSAAARKRTMAAGAADFLCKPFGAKELLQRVGTLLDAAARERAAAARAPKSERRSRQRTTVAVSAEIELLQRVAGAAEARDGQTVDHTRRVGELSAKLARELGLEDGEVELIRLTAPLHDIGKIAIPDGILMKTGTFSPEEFAVMKTHTIRGAEILAGGSSQLLVCAEQIARSHHEWWNGRGYPQGLVGEAIPLPARIVAVADVYDALTNPRSYRPAIPLEEVVSSMLEESGSHFDPSIIELLSDCV